MENNVKNTLRTLLPLLIGWSAIAAFSGIGYIAAGVQGAIIAILAMAVVVALCAFGFLGVAVGILGIWGADDYDSEEFPVLETLFTSVMITGSIISPAFFTDSIAVAFFGLGVWSCYFLTVHAYLKKALASQKERLAVFYTTLILGYTTFILGTFTSLLIFPAAVIN